MKTISSLFILFILLMLSSCGAVVGTATSVASQKVLGNVIGNTSGTLSNVISSALGEDKAAQTDLIGIWKYSSPGCAFTNAGALKKAGGEVMATQVKKRVEPFYQAMGVKDSTIVFQLNADSTYQARILDHKVSGKYTFYPETGKIAFKSDSLQLEGNVKKSSSGLALLFEPDKIQTLFGVSTSKQKAQDLNNVLGIIRNYKDIHIGFELVN